MARKIDFSKPLTEDEQAYVADRPWLVQDAILNGEEILSEDDWSLDGDQETEEERVEREAEVERERQAEAERERAAQEQRLNEAAAALAADKLANPGSSEEEESEEEESEESEEETEEVAPYDEWEYADLKTEAGNRGLKQSGSKEALVARLNEDDAENAE